MSQFWQGCRIAAITSLFALCASPPYPVAAAAVTPPTFVEESLADFSDAVRTEPHTESVQHLEPARYRAFRFLNSERVIVGAASEISLKPDGKVDIVQAPGTVLTVRTNTSHVVMSHIALLRDGKIDQTLLRKP